MTKNLFDNQNKHSGIKRLLFASQNSVKAFNWLYKNETAFKQELLLIVCLTPLSFLFDISLMEHAALIISLLFIIFTEILNTAIEVVVDRIGLEINPLSGLAKDLASFAVSISLIIAAIIWVAVLWPA